MGSLSAFLGLFRTFFLKNFANYEIVSIFAHLFGGALSATSEEAQVVKLVDTLL